ncbi:uncharacterized protein METZ01_LOCUS460715, partial [marine metagenome]
MNTFLLSSFFTFATLLAPHSYADLADLKQAKLKRGIVLVAGNIGPNV